MERILLVVLVLMLLAGIAFAEPVRIDVSSATCEIITGDTVRLRYVDLPDYNISAWADFRWNKDSFKLDIVDADLDTLSVVGDWVITHDWLCDSYTNYSYITLRTDHTIACTPESQYDTSCKTRRIYSGTWTLSGNTLTIFVTTSDGSGWNITPNSKLTGTLNGGTNYNGIQDGRMFIKDSATYDYTLLKGCWTATRVTQ